MAPILERGESQGTTPGAPPASPAGRAIDALAFRNRFVSSLPGDPATTNHRRAVLGACYSRVQPTPVPGPRLVALVPEVAALLDLSCRETPALPEVLAGNHVLPGMAPYAACYGGHQFGAWAGQLGDGRAITLAEVENDRGELSELQLKGAGATPYSRGADGRAVLRSSLRELVASEAMHHLGVPTTRAPAGSLRRCAPGGHARRQPALRSPELPPPAGDRAGRGRRPRGARPAARRPAPTLRGAARLRGIRRQATRVGPPPGRVLDALLQLLN